MRSATWRLCIVFVCVFFAKVWPANLHLFIVADVNGDGPGDLILKEAIKNDVASVRQEALLIAKNTGLSFQEQSFICENINMHKLVLSLKKIPSSNDDVIFFYFTGHGYTTTSQFDDPWPNLVIRNKGLKFSYVIETLKQSNARLKILFADCCNNILPDVYSPVIAKGYQPKRGSIRKNYKKLFLECFGVIAITGCKKSQVSLATAQGSFCTRSFFKSLHETIDGSVSLSSWQYVLDLANYKLHKTAQKYKRDQDLFFVIEN